MTVTFGLSGILILAFHLGFAGSSLTELPATPDPATILFRPGYVIRFNHDTLQADWVAYRLDAEEATANAAIRTDTFRPDPELYVRDTPDSASGPRRYQTADDADYRRSGYDRGHLVPAADMKSSMGSMVASFFYANVSPQDPSVNRGVWSRLEDATRREAISSGSVYVTCGPIFHNDRVTRDRVYIGSHRVPVPDAFFKVLLVVTDTQTKAIAFVIPNASGSANYFDYALSVDEAERITGLDFFHFVPDSVEERLEASYDSSLWFSGP